LRLRKPLNSKTYADDWFDRIGRMPSLRRSQHYNWTSSQKTRPAVSWFRNPWMPVASIRHFRLRASGSEKRLEWQEK